MPLNGLRSIHPKIEDYANLEVNSEFYQFEARK